MQQGRDYFSHHVMLGHFVHAIGAFGIAMLLQQYFKGNAFLPMWSAWLMVIISAAGHVRAWMGEKY